MEKETAINYPAAAKRNKKVEAPKDLDDSCLSRPQTYLHTSKAPIELFFLHAVFCVLRMTCACSSCVGFSWLFGFLKDQQAARADGGGVGGVRAEVLQVRVRALSVALGRQLLLLLARSPAPPLLPLSPSLIAGISLCLRFRWVPASLGTRTMSSSAHYSRGGGGGRGSGMRNDRENSRGRGGRGGDATGGGSGKDRIDALGRLLTRILRHRASELNLDMRSDGFVRVADLLNLNVKTFANVPLRSHTIDEVKEAVRRDNKQRFSLLEENAELLIRANQGHTIKTVESESLLKPIVSAEEVPVCVHGTYKRNLDSILNSGLKRMERLHVHFSCGLPTDGEVISGTRQDVNVLIFLVVKKALEGGMKLYISDNRVILTEGFDGVVPVAFFEKIVSWPDRRSIPFQT